jgi:phosphoserine phosphatase
VCFDVDSTVIPEEGIDVIAAHMGKGEQVAALTREAMEGTMDFRTALANRCAIIKPSRKDLQDLAAKHPVMLSPGVEEFIELLHSRGQHVYLVSGGFRQMINPVADAVNVPYHRVFANNLLFDEESGAYKGFDADEPTSEDGGKARVLDMLKQTHGYQTIVMIGDGATDMQAKPPADAFIGYGGTSARENVMAGADMFVYNFAELSSALLK